MSVVTVPLTPTRRHAVRTATLIRTPSASRVMGVLEIREAAADGPRPERALVYKLTEVPPLTADGRDFELRTPRGRFCCRVEVPDDPRDYPACGCTAFIERVWCLHCEALCALVAAGSLKPPPF